MSEKATINISVFKRLIAYMKPYKRYFTIAVLATILIAFVGPLRPLLIGVIIQKHVIEHPDKQLFLIWILIIVGLLVVEQFLQYISSYFANLLAQSVIRDLRKKLFSHILSFRMRYFDKTAVGALVTRVVSDMEAITEVFSAGLMDIAGDMISLLVVFAFMLYSNWQLTLLTITPIPLLILATRIFARAMRSSFNQERIQVTRLNTFVQEHLTGMTIVQLFNREKEEFEKFETINKAHRQAHINAVWAFSIFIPVVELLTSFSIAFMLVFGALKAQGKSSEEITEMFAVMISFTMWIQMLFRPIRQLADKFNILQRGTVRAERVLEILDTQDQIQDTGTINDCNFNQEIRFENVSFAYQHEEWVLKNINLKIEPGTTIAFVGATGAGKSTIVNLLGRFYEYQQGEIYIGDVNLKNIELSWLRKNIAVVLQDVFLFSDTIHNNITLNDPSISREQVIRAAKAVGADEFIRKLPDGYDYQVGERGGVLSVGQRQLLSFVRAAVYNPEILVLDEATSSVDNESEQLIQQATRELTKGRTSIVIAHRLSTIQNADKIVVLDKGEIKETGTHSELLQTDGYYRKLYDMQFREEKLENE